MAPVHLRLHVLTRARLLYICNSSQQRLYSKMWVRDADVQTASLTTTGGVTWPAARRLSEYLEAMESSIGLDRPGAQAVELGAGCGWLGITLARNISSIKLTLTEQENGGGLEWLAHNVKCNIDKPGVDRVTTAPCDWNDFGQPGCDHLTARTDATAWGASVSRPSQTSHFTSGEKVDSAPVMAFAGEQTSATQVGAGGSTSGRSLLDTKWGFVLVGGQCVRTDAADPACKLQFTASCIQLAGRIRLLPGCHARHLLVGNLL